MLSSLGIYSNCIFNEGENDGDATFQILDIYFHVMFVLVLTLYDNNQLQPLAFFFRHEL